MEFKLVQREYRGQKSVAYLDISDLDFGEKQDTYQKTLYFSMDSYGNLTKTKSVRARMDLPERIVDPWKDIFTFVNMFFEDISVEDRKAIVEFYIHAKAEITGFAENKSILCIRDLKETLGRMLQSLDHSINLCDKLFTFTRAKVPYTVMAEAGTRPQDTQEFTFRGEEILAITTLAVLTKIVSPIMAQILAWLKEKIHTDFKEVHCAAILDYIIDDHFLTVMEKLKNYMRHIVEVRYDPNVAASALMRDKDPEKLANDIFRTFIARKLVTYNFDRAEGSDLMRFIFVTDKKAASTAMEQIAKNPLYERKPVIPSRHTDDGNMSKMETDSTYSEGAMADVALAKVAVRLAIRRHLNGFELDKELYKQSVIWYINNPMIPNTVALNVCALLFRRDFGGSRGIRMLNAADYIKIVTLAQMIVFKLNQTVELPFMLTARPTIPTGNYNSTTLRLNYSGSVAYKECRNRYAESAYTVKGREWDKHVADIVDELSKREYLYHTAIPIWQSYNQEPRNNEVIPITEQLITDYATLFNTIQTNPYF